MIARTLLTMALLGACVSCGDDQVAPAPDASCDVVVGDVCYVCDCTEPLDPATSRPCAAYCADVGTDDDVDGGAP